MCRRRKSLYEHPAENQSRMSKSHHAGEECRNRYDVGCVVSPVPDQWPQPSAVAVRRQQDRRSPCRRAGGLPQQSPGDDGSRPLAAGRCSSFLQNSIPRSSCWHSHAAKCRRWSPETQQAEDRDIAIQSEAAQAAAGPHISTRPPQQSSMRNRISPPSASNSAL